MAFTTHEDLERRNQLSGAVMSPDLERLRKMAAILNPRPTVTLKNLIATEPTPASPQPMSKTYIVIAEKFDYMATPVRLESPVKGTKITLSDPNTIRSGFALKAIEEYVPPAPEVVVVSENTESAPAPAVLVEVSASDMPAYAVAVMGEDLGPAEPPKAKPRAKRKPAGRKPRRGR